MKKFEVFQMANAFAFLAIMNEKVNANFVMKALLTVKNV